jgi:ribosomal protein S18 acetylase RimI-like enzyme
VGFIKPCWRPPRRTALHKARHSIPATHGPHINLAERLCRNVLMNNPQSGGLRLRPEQAGDESVLFEIYASTRKEELDLTGWDAATRQAFLNHQFSAMRAGYRSMFPQAAFSMILLGERPIGRQVVDRTPDEIRLVDIALLPEFCGRGLGGKLMRDLLLEAAEAKKPIRLQVVIRSRAKAFYTRLGFRPVGEPDVYETLEWLPEFTGRLNTA